MNTGALHSHNDELPDAANGDPCCMGYAVYGPDRCTCWQPVYEPAKQAEARTEEFVTVRERRCGDCAYRRDSPEAVGAPHAGHDSDDLAAVAAGDNPFWCHQGMRKLVQYQHPSGATFVPDQDSFGPENVDAVPYQADGTPAQVCRGWFAEHRRITGSAPTLVGVGVRS